MSIESMEEKGAIISSQYVRNILEISKRYNEAANQSIQLNNMFEAMQKADTTKQIFKIHGRNFFIANIPVKQDDNIDGYMITMKDVSKIQEVEHELRRKLRKQEHNAVYQFKDIFEKSKVMQKTLDLAGKLSVSSSTVFIRAFTKICSSYRHES